MVSERRRARMRVPESEAGVPGWLWEFDGRQWGWHSKNPRSSGGRVDGHYDARVRWHAACSAWLDERGLVTWEHNAGSWEDFLRIEREEPHRILRRPQQGET
ncbi:hypothetical protein [Streptomyces sp. NPDC047014]|uniref:hypothetical protein n=1 Tax=Streptomyces sp. NPDC047014 TaxID=3155736 RepID=UPI0033EA87C6